MLSGARVAASSADAAVDATLVGVGVGDAPAVFASALSKAKGEPARAVGRKRPAPRGGGGGRDAGGCRVIGGVPMGSY